MLIVHGRWSLVRAACGGCGRNTNFIPLEEVSNSSRHDAESLRRMAEDGVIHAIETEHGAPMICLRSALKLPGDSDGPGWSRDRRLAPRSCSQRVPSRRRRHEAGT
jgi:hypothetical protein